MPLPSKILSRSEEITADFLRLVNQHVNDLLHKKVTHRYHARDFARLLFIHPGHLSNTLKLTTGKSPCDFIEERIMEEARRMLKETDMPVADIASHFAYDEPTNFIKFFKGMAGLTPLQYRKKTAAGD